MNPIPIKPIRLTILSSPAHLPVVRAAAEKMCELMGFTEEAIGAIILSIDEALTNIIRHAYHGASDKKIDVEFSPEGEGGGNPTQLKVVLRDYGRQVDPSQIKSRDLDDVRPGGLGVHIINECMDSVAYTHADGCGTELVMTKEIFASKNSLKNLSKDSSKEKSEK